MDILILGKGFVGTHLAHYCRINNIAHRIFSQSELDYTNPLKFYEYITQEGHNIKCIINCSGYTGVPNVDACEDNKELCYNYNVKYPFGVARVADHFNIPLIHIGSGCIYSGYDKDYTETDTPNFGFFSNESSYYSKCKHLFEEWVRDLKCHVLRIRIPFTADDSRKNYFSKLLKYDTLINENNSITSITDFNDFLFRFIEHTPPFGVYNVVNPQPVKAKQVVELMQKYGLNNPNWKFIDVKDLNTKANRSNCVLSTHRINQFGLSLPDTLQSLERDIKLLAKTENS